MDICCSYSNKSVEYLLYDAIISMKICKTLELSSLREVFKNLDFYKGDNEYIDRITSISEKVKKNFENSQKQLLREKFMLICTKYIYDNDPNNKFLVFHEKFLEKIFELCEGKKDKMILLMYSLLVSSQKKNYFIDLFFIAAFGHLENENIKYVKFKNLLCEYIHKLLFSSYSALGIFYSNNTEVFDEILDKLNNTIINEKVQNFTDVFLKNFEEEKFSHSNDRNFFVKNPPTGKKVKIDDDFVIHKDEIKKILVENEFLNNIFELIQKYTRFYDERKGVCD